MLEKLFSPVAVFTVAACLAGCGGATKEMNLSFDQVGTMPIDAAKCAARMSGWNITSQDQQAFSATKAFGMDSVPVNLNVMMQSDGKNVRVSVSNPRGIIGNGDYYTRDFTGAFSGCGAKPNVQYIER